MKKEVTDNVVTAGNRKNPCRSSQISTKRKPVKLVGGNFQHPLIFFHKEMSKKMAGREIKGATVKCYWRYRTQSLCSTQQQFTLETNTNTSLYSEVSYRWTYTNWGDWVEIMWVLLRKNRNWRKAKNWSAGARRRWKRNYRKQLKWSDACNFTEQIGVRGNQQKQQDGGRERWN